MTTILQLLPEGISNIGGSLTQDVLKFVSDNFDTMIKGGTKTFKTSVVDRIGNQHNISLYITISFRNNDTHYQRYPEYHAIRIGIKRYLIEYPDLQISSKLQSFNKHPIYSYLKSKILSEVAHEITHLSQRLSGFQKFQKGKTFKHDYSYKDPIGGALGHQERPTEHEAVLIGLFEYLKNNKFNEAIKELDYAYTYLRNFTFKQFVSKAYYYGVSRQQLEKFKDKIKGSIILSTKLSTTTAGKLLNDIRPYSELRKTLNLTKDYFLPLKDFNFELDTSDKFFSGTTKNKYMQWIDNITKYSS